MMQIKKTDDDIGILDSWDDPNAMQNAFALAMTKTKKTKIKRKDEFPIGSEVVVNNENK